MTMDHPLMRSVSCSRFCVVCLSAASVSLLGRGTREHGACRTLACAVHGRGPFRAILIGVTETSIIVGVHLVSQETARETLHPPIHVRVSDWFCVGATTASTLAASDGLAVCP